MLRSICPSCKKTLLLTSSRIWFEACYSTVTLGDEEVPVIRFPLSKQREFVKVSKQKKKKGKVIIVPRPGKLLVSTSERKLDMYTNEFPTKFQPPTLASQTWTSHKSPGRHFTIHPTQENPSIHYKDKDTTCFENLNLTEKMRDALHKNNIITPTNIQAKAIPAILGGDNVMLAAETGSGKTYAYLLPLIQKLIEANQNKALGSESPAALILTPSKELSNQVCRMTHQLSLPATTLCLDSHWLKKKKQPNKDVNILVSTPVLTLAALRRRLLSLDHLRFAVVDECDTLLDESFSKYVCSILGRINIQKGVSRPLLSETEVQLVLCSATFPQYAEKALEDVISISDVSAISTGYTHRISPHVAHKFLRVKPSEKFPTLLSLLRDSAKRNELVMVFCNRRDSVTWLSKELMFHGISAAAIHNQLDIKERLSVGNRMNSLETPVVVCTDLSSRGMDTQKVGHVINYEFPNMASDYIHRGGRVGRVGQHGEGRVTNLISKKYEVPLVMKIEEAARRRERIEGVNANIKSYHTERWKKLQESADEAMDAEFE